MTRLEALDHALEKLRHALEDIDDAGNAVIAEPGPTPGQIAYLSGSVEGVIELVRGERRQLRRLANLP